MLSKPILLSEIEESGISCVGVKSNEGTPKAKAALWVPTDAGVQKHGKQTRLDTLVVHDVHNECSPLVYVDQEPS